MGMQSKKVGWSFGSEGHQKLPRHELPSEHFHGVERIADPSSPAWDEPGYVDPDWHHASLPDGARYWQGYVKQINCPAHGEERPLSPELVARVTHSYYPEKSAHARHEDSDPNWRRRMHESERNLFSRFRAKIWPG